MSKSAQHILARNIRILYWSVTSSIPTKDTYNKSKYVWGGMRIPAYTTPPFLIFIVQKCLQYKRQEASSGNSLRYVVSTKEMYG